MGQALYRKYRSQSFDELIGQEHVVKTLHNAIKDGRLSHAYLFSGPRGVGKTSAARLLAYKVNKFEFEPEGINLDIIEIDAASNRRIEEVRDLRDKVHTLPVSGKYKVYIIDEAHMLTREAFNALLKTLEEPPAHCIFILATTEAHKLPETIVSRTQKFVFRPIEAEIMLPRLKKISKIEKISISDQALQLVAAHSGGSFRDALSILDQLSSNKHNGEIKIDEVQQIIGLPPQAIVNGVYESLLDQAPKKLVEQLNQAKLQGVSASLLAQELATKLRNDLIESDPKLWKIKLTKKLLDVQSSQNVFDRLELFLLEATLNRPKPSETKKSTTAPDIQLSAKPVQASTDSLKVAVSVPSMDRNISSSFSLRNWPELLEDVKANNASIYTALRLAQPDLTNNTLLLSFNFSLHKDKINQPATKRNIQKLIEDRFGSQVSIECRVEKKPIATPAKQPAANSPIGQHPLTDDLKTISNIFGGSEVLES